MPAASRPQIRAQAANTHKKLTASAAAVNCFSVKRIVGSTVKIIPLPFAFFYQRTIIRGEAGAAGFYRGLEVVAGYMESVSGLSSGGVNPQFFKGSDGEFNDPPCHGLFRH